MSLVSWFEFLPFPLANRTEPNTIDVFHAFEEVGVSLRELLEYFNGMEVDAQFDPAVPSFPVHKAQSHVHRCASFSPRTAFSCSIVLMPCLLAPKINAVFIRTLQFSVVVIVGVVKMVAFILISKPEQVIRSVVLLKAMLVKKGKNRKIRAYKSLLGFDCA